MRRALILLLLASPAPVLAQPWATEAQRAAGRQAMAASVGGRTAEADGFATNADPLVRKIVTWDRLQRRGQAGASELVAFAGENPDWPAQDALLRRTEEALATDSDDALAIAHFARFPARTLDGAARQADALSRSGRGAEAAAPLRAAWISATPDALAEESLLARYAALLTADAHAERFDRLAWSRDFAAAGRQAPRLDGNRRANANLRLSMASDGADPDSAASSRDIGVLAERARLLRRRDRDAEAAAVWATAAPLQRNLPEAGQRAIWTERQVLARKLLRLGDARAAYNVAANHGQAIPGEPRQEAEFLAGWFALRKLDEPAMAQRHFVAVGEGANSVITRARSGYWQGRALMAQQQTVRAREKFAEAAAYPTAFYGQLAALALDPDPGALSARINGIVTATLTPPQVAGFGEREMVRAVLALNDLGYSSRTRQFLLRLEDLAPDAGDRLMIARLANVTGRPDNAVWVARRAGADGVMIHPEGWPTPVAAPDGGAEAALVFGIARQESNFDASAVSSANARGLMQLIPSTAAATARRVGVPYALPMLTQDPSLNLRLGSAYLAEMMDRFGGSVVLAAAAYNAGPRRADEWMGTYGDPRGGTDPLDWIEQIPFSETRNYVQRIIENLVVYRARTADGGGREHPLRRTLLVAN
ncbi:lytic transglycosylase domain-containing protein [Humitalea sp. 24SJ18S-53]|uniref:lytic transglycosylase domain-containing protein n=1 Tax=Humitalea sp. 24SJ18S-53 TaxID=3422307 RepID=UPI003D67AA01